MGNYRQFNSLEFGLIRIVTVNNEPYFVGKDTTKVTGKGQVYFINKFLQS